MYLPGGKWPTYYNKAKGINIWGIDGKKYFDFTMVGIGTSVLGYSDKDINSTAYKVIKSGYNLLNLINYFTCGPKETRSWTIEKNTLAPQAAGKIHSDFEKGFIRAETISYDDFVEFKGESFSREAGKLRQEGKDYIVRDGDILNFLFNV